MSRVHTAPGKHRNARAAKSRRSKNRTNAEFGGPGAKSAPARRRVFRSWTRVALVAAPVAVASCALAFVLTHGQARTGIKAPAGPVAGTTAVATPIPAVANPSAATTAIDEAAQANRYIFLFFYRAEDEPTLAARKTLDAAMEKLADRATSTAVNITDPQEQALVIKYGLNRSPMPLVLAMAPTGAVTRGFPGQFTEADLEMAFVSPALQQCLKALQDRKMAFLCVQSGTTQHNAEAMRGVKEFAADAQYAKTTEIIIVDPTDAAEESLLKQLKVDPKTDEAVTVFLAPPGTMVGTYKGEIKKDVLVAAAKTAAQGCAPGSTCAPGSSCGPAPKKP